MLTARTIYWPSINAIGPGALTNGIEEASKYGFKKALVVSDPILEKIGIVEKVLKQLDKIGLEYSVYTNVSENPTVANVHTGLEEYKKNECDCLVSIGGGSPQDTASAIAILATNGGDIRDYNGIGISSKKSAPIIAINTTAGTAAEVTINCVITDTEKKIKMVIVDPNSIPLISINDPELMLEKPKGLTAATGMDALTHAIEAYVSTGAFELSDAISYKAIEFISRSLVAAVENGNDLEARSQMAWGSFTAGLAFSNCGLGLVHSMAHQLGSEYNLPHGVANAILLPFVMEYNLEANLEKFAQIAVAMGEKAEGKTIEELANASVKRVRELSKEVKIPALNETKFDVKDVEKLAKQAMVDPCTGGNPKGVTEKDIEGIYIKAFNY